MGATGSTLNLATAGNGDRGDLIRVRATVNDGSLTSAPVTSSPVTVANSAPVATVTLAPANPGTGATAHGHGDQDAMPMPPTRSP